MSDRSFSQICISASPPLAQRRARYLLKRMAVALPKVPIVTALWGASEHRVQRLRAVTSSAVVTTVKSALAEIRENLPSPARQEDSEPTPSLVPEPDKLPTG
jgi:hypothetical protein